MYFILKHNIIIIHVSCELGNRRDWGERRCSVRLPLGRIASLAELHGRPGFPEQSPKQLFAGCERLCSGMSVRRRAGDVSEG